MYFIANKDMWIAQIEINFYYFSFNYTESNNEFETVHV